MSTIQAEPPAPPARSSKYWIDHWEPEDPEHIGFSVWVMWSVLVLFMGQEYGLSPADKFLLVALPQPGRLAAAGALHPGGGPVRWA